MDSEMPAEHEQDAGDHRADVPSQSVSVQDGSQVRPDECSALLPRDVRQGCARCEVVEPVERPIPDMCLDGDTVGDQASAGALTRAADNALYRAKEAGRNRVEVLLPVATEVPGSAVPAS